MNAKSFFNQKNIIIITITAITILVIAVVLKNNYNKKGKDVIAQENHNYNIYMSAVTLPSFFSLMDIEKNEQTPAFCYIAKTDMINKDEILKKHPNFVMSENCGKKDESDFLTLVIPEAQQYVKDTIMKDSEAHFCLYIDEYRFYAEFPLFAELGLTDDQYDVKLYSDGTLSYAKDYEITEENVYDKYLEETKKYNEYLEKARNGEYLNKKQGVAEYLKDNQQYYLSYNYDYIFISSLRKNITYYLQYPELIEFKDEKIADIMKNSNMKKIEAQYEYEQLNDEEKVNFIKYVNIDKALMDNKYFNAENGKYLIITGTRPFFGNGSEEGFKNTIREICNKYQNEYEILYKPHPSALPDENQEKILEENNIKILPGKIPMEAISFIYPELKLGGYASSLYMSVDKGKTLFFFAKDKNDLVEPLNKLYDSLFSDAEFMNV